jgi:hypothetical protein
VVSLATVTLPEHVEFITNILIYGTQPPQPQGRHLAAAAALSTVQHNKHMNVST